VFPNVSTQTLKTIAHEISYREVPAIAPEAAYFHACFRRENPTREGVPYTILDAHARDPQEHDNLAARAEHATVIAEMKRWLPAIDAPPAPDLMPPAR